MSTPSLTIDGREYPLEEHGSVLELCRAQGIDIPTFCYHSHLSTYGACRLCMVEIEGRGAVTSCSTVPEAGMKIRTNSADIRRLRRVAMELLLASHDQSCTTCKKSGACKLQDLAQRLGASSTAYPQVGERKPIDDSAGSVRRDPNRCELCGDCVRVCDEIQGVGAIDISGRGSNCVVTTSFDQPLKDSNCVHCGQCAAVCPTGAITVHSETEAVWQAIHDPQRKVMVQIAPAVRVALAEAFGMRPDGDDIGRLVAALRRMGVDTVYDTCFSADITILEEGNELLERVQKGEHLPQFTSCCPAWVNWAEKNLGDLLPHMSSCKSPQQIFGSLAKHLHQQEDRSLTVVSIMPCTAKKVEAQNPAFSHNGTRDVDHVLSTQGVIRMIREAGLDWSQLEPEPFDMPMGFTTGGGVLFGTSGGVSEAALRYVVEKLSGKRLDAVEFTQVRGSSGLREAQIQVGENELRLAVVHGLAQAQALVERIRAGSADYHFIEVMACPSGCVGGAGQPVADLGRITQRSEAIYRDDRRRQLHKSQENHLVHACYAEHIGAIGGETAHHLFHRGYQADCKALP